MLCCIYIVYFVLCCISHSGKEERLQPIARSLNYKSINQSINHPPYNLSAWSCYSSTAVFNECYSELTPYTALANCCGGCVYDAYQFQATPISDNDYSCHITAVELV